MPAFLTHEFKKWSHWCKFRDSTWAKYPYYSLKNKVDFIRPFISYVTTPSPNDCIDFKVSFELFQIFLAHKCKKNSTSKQKDILNAIPIYWINKNWRFWTFSVKILLSETIVSSKSCFYLNLSVVFSLHVVFPTLFVCFLFFALFSVIFKFAN